MKETISIDGYLFKNGSDSDGKDIEISFESTDLSTLSIIVDENEYTVYGEDRIYDLIHRMVEIWYPKKEPVVMSADE